MENKRKILYASRLCSPRIMEYVFTTSVIKPGQQAQKFHRLLAEGFVMHNDSCSVETLSTIPVTPTSHKRRIWRLSPETVDNIKYNYAPMINLPLAKNLMVFVYAFFKAFLWGLSGGRKDKVAICDVLNLSITSATLLACKATRIRAVAVVTDIPDLLVSGSQKCGFKRKLFSNLVSGFMTNCDGYILLTEQMNERVNVRRKPYVIMEGLVDKNMITIPNVLEKKAPERILSYTGGIYEKYGIKKLIEAFMRLDAKDARLHIYGPGPMAEEMPNYIKQDNRIVYFGIVENKVVIQTQLEATLLINPRPSTEELTKYSFPSKNMEYMVSGTPVVTTPLPGMPKEYNPYVYLFDDESVDGIYQTLKNLLAKPKVELYEFGQRAKEFVLTYKSNLKQAERILDYLKVL